MLNLEVADKIKGKDVAPEKAMRAIKARLEHRNPNVQLLALKVGPGSRVTLLARAWLTGSLFSSAISVSRTGATTSCSRSRQRSFSTSSRTCSGSQ
jgi:hypothetical protein